MTTCKTKPTTMRAADAARLIEGTRGRWFTATFVKRTDGTLRRMTCRTGVRKGVTGAGAAYDADARGLRVVWAADRLTFRMLGLDAITELRIAGRTYRACAFCGDVHEDRPVFRGFCSAMCWGEMYGEGYDG